MLSVRTEHDHHSTVRYGTRREGHHLDATGHSHLEAYDTLHHVFSSTHRVRRMQLYANTAQPPIHCCCRRRRYRRHTHANNIMGSGLHSHTKPMVLFV